MENSVQIIVKETVKVLTGLDESVAFVEKILEKMNYNHEEITILFCDNEYMQKLNLEFRGIDSPTDVLSFELDDDFGYVDEESDVEVEGNIAISLEMVQTNADYFSTTFNDELKRLLVHGVLHCNGMDHGEEHIEVGVEPKCEMLVLQEKLLKEFENEKIPLTFKNVDISKAILEN